MKRTIIVFFVAIIMVFCFCNYANASQVTLLQEDNTNNIIQMKKNVNSKLEEYKQKYNSETYGIVAYVLNTVRWYSIPICFMGIIVGALNQYVLGTRRLDRKHKGYGMIMTFVTLLVICQVLPLIFTLVVIGWRG